MARLRDHLEGSDDELPELSTLLRGAAIGNPRKTSTQGRTVRKSHAKSRTAKQEVAIDQQRRPTLSTISPVKTAPGSSQCIPTIAPQQSRTSAQASYNEAQQAKRTQRPLKLAHTNSLLLPISRAVSAEETGKAIQRPREASAEEAQSRVRASPTRRAKQKVEHGRFGPWSDLEEEGSSGKDEDDEDFTDLEGFVVDDDEELSYDDESDVEEKISHDKTSGRASRKPKDLPKKAGAGLTSVRELDAKLNDLCLEPEGISAIVPPPKLNLKPQSFLRASNGSPKKSFPGIEREGNAFEEPDAILKFSPPQPRSPVKMASPSRGTGFITPPSSPSKPKLQSPFKNRSHIPPSPHRPSIDAFWSADVINDWNDQYSPKKTPRTRRKGLSKFLIYSSDEEDSSSLKDEDSPTTSPRKPSPIKPSPSKKSEEKKLLAARKKAFDDSKHSLATNFLEDLDSKITNGQISALSASAGGVKIVWSKNLRSTAGRASWRRTVSKASDEVKLVQHHASIELAEKVIDDEERLVNTVAHEFCHLANFMVSNIKNNPHGESFKNWAHKVTSAFANHPQYKNVVVTTKHTYEINHKYVWVCEQDHCATQYGRHSKSIDPIKHRCGRCKGGLVQVKPKPRGVGKSPTKKKAVQRNPLDGLKEMDVQQDNEENGMSVGTLKEELEIIELDD